MLALRQSVATFGHSTSYKLWFMVFIYLDFALTLFAVQRGFTEVNPYMVRLLDDPSQLLLVKGLIPLFIAWLVPGKLLLPSIGIMVVVAAWNGNQLLTLIA